LQEEGLAFPDITGIGNKEWIMLTADRIKQHFAGSVAHQTATTEEQVQHSG
jgi:hypothetical protein